MPDKFGLRAFIATHGGAHRFRRANILMILIMSSVLYFRLAG